jgi:fibrillarin-like rRNA methylase
MGLCLLALSSPELIYASETYQKPSSEILELVDVKMAPIPIINDARENMLLIERDTYN